MTFEKTPIRDVFVITPLVREDERGFFMESYKQDAAEAAGIKENFVQDNHSKTNIKHTIRGLHFQWDPPMGKLMRVSRGSAFLVAVDIRKGSPTLGKWFGIEATEDNKKQLYAPAGFARGFQTLSDVCEVLYKSSGLYNKNAESELNWADPEVGIQWPAAPALLSPRDTNAKMLKDWLARPESNFFTY